MLIKARVATNIASWDKGYQFTDEALEQLVKDAPGKDVIMPTGSQDAHVGKIVSAKLVEKGGIKFVEVTAEIDQLWLVTRGVDDAKTEEVKDGISVIHRLLLPRFVFSPEPDIDDGQQPPVGNNEPTKN